MTPENQPKLRGISDIRRYFYRNETPTFFFSATNFNLLGMDEWVRSFRHVAYIDCFDGEHPHLFVPKEAPHRVFTSIEEINNYLLEHKEVVDFIQERLDGGRGRAVFLMFDEKTEELCKELNLDVCFPPANLRTQIDDKIETTRIGDRAGIASVPNVLAKVDSYAQLRDVSSALGNELVLQTAFGDSGHTTFFVSNEAEYSRHEAELLEAPEVKIMKRINCRGAAQEACVTRHGTIVGPLMTELVGFPSLTPYKGGWCGNEVLAESFSRDVRDKAREMTIAFGEELRKIGYRGYFELDFLRDLDTDTLYLGEVNPRITGASAMTNLASFAHADAPLFLFHLLEFSDVDFELDVDELNERWSDPENIDGWGQLVMKHTGNVLQVVTEAPATGVYRLRSDGTAEFVRVQTHRRTVEREDHGFFLRITKPGDWFYEGADLGILITPGRLMTDDFALNERAQSWISAMSQLYTGDVPEADSAVPIPPVEPGGFKFL